MTDKSLQKKFQKSSKHKLETLFDMETVFQTQDSYLSCSGPVEERTTYCQHLTRDSKRYLQKISSAENIMSLLFVSSTLWKTRASG